jgi:Tfp pilus assembly protein PilZ
MADKRREKRKISRTKIKFGDETCEKTAFTSNLSPKGFFVRTNRVFQPDTVLQFEFVLSDGEVVHIEGRVAHASRVPAHLARLRRCGMGIEIVKEDHNYINLLKTLNIIEE